MKLILLIIAIFGIFAEVSAIAWSSGTSGEWNAGANWVGGTFPTNAQTAEIVAVGNYTVTIGNAVSVGAATLATALVSLTLGAAGSTPTLLINGGTVNVLTLNLVNGKIVLNNGATLNLFTSLKANLAARSQIEVINGTVNGFVGTLLTGGMEVTNNTLEIIGQFPIKGTTTIGAAASLVLSGSHSIDASSSFAGSGSVVFNSGSTVELAATCTADAVLILRGANIRGKADNVSKKITAKAIEIQGQANETTTLAVETAVSESCKLVSGALAIGANAKLTATAAVEASSDTFVQVSGEVVANAGIAVTKGQLILVDAVVSTQTNVQANVETGATLIVEKSTAAKTTISNKGRVILRNAISAGNAVAERLVVIGGEVQFQASASAEASISAGTVVVQNATVSGQATVEASAVLILERVRYIRGEIKGAGKCVINTIIIATSNAEAAIFATASFENQGTVDVQQGTLAFSGNSSISGDFTVQNVATLVIQGDVRTSANVNVDGTIKVVSGALRSIVGQIRVTKDVVVESSGQIVVENQNNAQGNITILGNLLMSGASRAIVKATGLLKVSGGLVLNATSAFHAAGGKCESGSLSMTAEATYVVNVNSATSVVLNVLGAANLGGHLIANIDAAFTFNAGASVTVLTYQSRQGEFQDAKTEPPKAQNQEDSVQYTPTEARMERSESQQPTETSGASTIASLSIIGLMALSYAL